MGWWVVGWIYPPSRGVGNNVVQCSAAAARRRPLPHLHHVSSPSEPQDRAGLKVWSVPACLYNLHQGTRQMMESEDLCF